MENLTQAFEQAQQDVKTLTSRPSNDDLLSLYALFKQATAGNAPAKGPSPFNFSAFAKHQAWSQLADSEADSCMQQYIDKVAQLLGR